MWWWAGRKAKGGQGLPQSRSRRGCRGLGFAPSAPAPLADAGLGSGSRSGRASSGPGLRAPGLRYAAPTLVRVVICYYRTRTNLRAHTFSAVTSR